MHKLVSSEGTTSYPAGAECIEVIRVSGSVAEQIPLYV